MTLYAFDGVDNELKLVPIAARRALDQAGIKLSLDAWQRLGHSERLRLVEAGARDNVDRAAVEVALTALNPAPLRIEPIADPPSDHVPSEISEAFASEGEIAPAVWSALSRLDRYALSKVARGRDRERIGPAYREIIGHSAYSTHVAAQGGVRMVSVSEKQLSLRRAVAHSQVSMRPEALARVVRADAPKGDVLGTARLAGIMAAKRTSEIIPLCHPIALTKIEVELSVDETQNRVAITATVEAFDRTGVEMEAMTAATTAALTVYDMLKAFDRGMKIGPTQLLEKSGGRSGDFHA